MLDLNGAVIDTGEVDVRYVFCITIEVNGDNGVASFKVWETKKLNWIQRKIIKHFLGFIWVDKIRVVDK